MSRSSLSARLRPGLLMLLLGSMLFAPPTQPAAAASVVDLSDPDRIKIDVNVEVFDGTQQLADQWASAIARYWNTGPDGKPFTYCGRTVEINVNFDVTPTGQAGYHFIQVKWLRPGQVFTSTVHGYPDYDPTLHDRTGIWQSQGGRSSGWYDALAAHEFGHLLGLRDEYVWDPDRHDTNGDGKRSPGEPTAPDTANFPDAAESIMGASKGRVLQRHIDELMRAHGVDEELEDCFELAYWHGTMERTYVEDLTSLYEVESWHVQEELFMREFYVVEHPPEFLAIGIEMVWSTYEVEVFTEDRTEDDEKVLWVPNPFNMSGSLSGETFPSPLMGSYHLLDEAANPQAGVKDGQYSIIGLPLSGAELDWPSQFEYWPNDDTPFEGDVIMPVRAILAASGPEYLLTEDMSRMQGTLHEEFQDTWGTTTLDANWDFRRVQELIPPP